MNTGLVTGIATFLGLAVIAAAAVFVIRASERSRRQKRAHSLQEDRTMDYGTQWWDDDPEQGSLQSREQPFELRLRELSAQSRLWYEREWARVQEYFFVDPEAAVVDADQIAAQALAERGYPTEDPGEPVANLTAEHAETLDSYQKARAVADRSRAGMADAEELRAAMIRYRAIFTGLLRDVPPGARRRGKHAKPEERDRGRPPVPGPRTPGADRGTPVQPGRGPTGR